MPGINNNLYPPIFKTAYAPAFADECRVYFAISNYNNLDDIDINKVQVIVQNQKTNQSVLKKESYPSGIKIASLKTDLERAGDDRYYIELMDSDIEGKTGFSYNQYYKVQIRFTAKNKQVKNISNSQKIDNWLNETLQYFSQWSTVVLIKPVSRLKISLKYFEQESQSNTLTTNSFTVLGQVKHEADSDREELKNYRISVYTEDGELLEDSGQLLFNEDNQIQYHCRYNFQNGDYKIKVSVLTKNLYFQQQVFDFQVSAVAYTNFEAVISADIDNKNACAVISVKKDLMVGLNTNIVIQRTSNKEGFKYWQDVYTTSIPANSILNFTWRDYTIESGVWYKYRVSKRNQQNFRSIPIEIKNPIMADFEDIFLTNTEGQLKIRFDPQINNFSKVVSESLVETIGSQYPFIRRNGKVGYKTFSISGTISYLTDIGSNLMHASKTQLYGDSANLYKEYNQQNNINLYNDITQEKVFRDKVLDFLYENNVKLYKSSTEGNLLVKLMNISLTPNNTLSRQIYSFTCTAYEIDTFNYNNCIKYFIQDPGQYVQEDILLIQRYGQLYYPNLSVYYPQEDESKHFNNNDLYFGAGQILSTLIKQKYQTLTSEDIDININKLSYLKITLTSPPYLIGVIENQPYRITDSTSVANAVYSGHIVKINGVPIIINKDGIYQLSNDDTAVTSLQFISPYEQGVIDFEVYIEESEKQKVDFKGYNSFNKIGQLWGTFSFFDSLKENLCNNITNRYLFTNDSYEQEVQQINGIRFQAEPGTVIFVRENQDGQYEKHILNETGLLQFYDQDTNIQGFYFMGPKLEEVSAEEKDKYGLKPYQFFNTNEPITLDVIKHPQNNYVYYFSSYNSITDTLTVPAGQLHDYGDNEIDGNALVISDNTLNGNLIGPNILQLYSNLNDTTYTWDATSQEARELNNETLGLLFATANSWIYYQGVWYPFSLEHQVPLTQTEAIIDYYCTVLKRRY